MQKFRARRMLFTGVLICGVLAMSTLAQSAHGQGASPKSSARGTAHKTSPYRPGVADSARNYYLSVWGIDNLLVRETASGNLIRFSYQVVDPVRAAALGDNRATPYLYGQRSRAVLQVPVMDKVGRLRQAGKPEAGKEYWMVFSNKGNPVKAGDRVNVVIGSFHADGLITE